MSVREGTGNGEWLLPQKNAKDPSCGKKATLLQLGRSPARRRGIGSVETVQRLEGFALHYEHWWEDSPGTACTANDGYILSAAGHPAAKCLGALLADNFYRVVLELEPALIHIPDLLWQDSICEGTKVTKVAGSHFSAHSLAPVGAELGGGPMAEFQVAPHEPPVPALASWSVFERVFDFRHPAEIGRLLHNEPFGEAKPLVSNFH
ncbi:hypothetical protein ElyMa_006133600 [Elysia marginata]|uniref:Uncharacterized protein n=1 Tax=Elysia marginata TaxID=1093978 RepID=A0AAV4GZ43_9GAST|nr:hypothetical protein ElyMa_006133600 [Elysia marginata]